MHVSIIIDRINEILSNNSSFKLSYDKLKFFLDNAVDNINRELRTSYLTIDEVYYKDFKYNYALCSGYTPLYIRANDEKYSVILGNGYIALKDSATDEYYDGIADAVYLEEYDTLYVKSSGSEYTHIFDVIMDESEMVNTKYIIGKLNYTEIPDRYIRSCLIYYTAALYLEEEDELESQYQIYKNKAQEELIEWKHEYYSCYDTRW